jgi:hypothetical protein
LVLDAKSGLLFSLNTVKSSYALRKEVKKILTNHKPGDTFSKNSMYNLRKFIAPVELSLKHELGVFGYKNPSTVENIELSKTYSEMRDKEKDESTNRP